MDENEISKKILDASFRLHTELGPGLLESVYEQALTYELREDGLIVVTQQAVPLVYKEVRLDMGYRMDMLVNQKVIVEIKSVEELAPVHFAQLLTYLKLADKRLGLLINFNTSQLKDGIRRVANGMPS